jgi:signal transduction histidine kinase
MNLVANAIDACPEQGMVQITTTRNGSANLIEVTDTGPGVDPAIRHRIFDPFFTTKKMGEGTGLGLSISYGIVRDHGGSITVDRAVSGGARFVVILPDRSRAPSAS